jgi:LysR family transcriptional regulator, cell division regulator
MNLHDLKLFEAVVFHGNFTRAADAMHTVQSNVTARIKALEDAFEVQLLSRTPRKVSLTSAGEKLLYYSKQINHLLEEARQEIHAAGQVVGELKIGSIETTLALKVPAMINEFSQEYPDVLLAFKSGLPGDLIQDVLHYKLDAAFVSAPIDIPELQERYVQKDKLVLVTALNMDIKTALSAKVVRVVVFDQGCSYRGRLEAWLNAKGVSRYTCTIMNTMEGIVNFVEAGVGISVLPEDLVTQFYSHRKINTFSLGRGLDTLSTVLIYRKDVPQSAALKAFVALYK